MQQASANVSDSFSFRFRQLFWSHRKAIRVQLTRPRGGVEHRSRSKKSHATRLQISTKSTWTARSLQTSLLEEKYPVLRISHFTSCVCVLTEVCMQCDQVYNWIPSTPLSQKKSDIYMTCKVQPGQNLLSLFSFILQHKSKNIVSCIMQRRWNVFTTVQYFLKHLSSHCQLVLP